MTTLLTNIRILVNTHDGHSALRGEQLAQLPVMENAWLQVEDDRIVSFGTMSDIPPNMDTTIRQFDARGGMVLPAWCDSHTHIVFAGSREEEFVDKIRGLSYTEVAAR